MARPFLLKNVLVLLKKRKDSPAWCLECWHQKANNYFIFEILIS